MTLLIAHRGYSARYRENSPSAWCAAVDAGADLIEIDIRFSTDGIAVCAHDATLERLAGLSQRIDSLPAAALTAIEVADESVVPLFARALEIIPPGIGLLLDMKDESPAALQWLDTLLSESRRSLIAGLHDADSVATIAGRGHGPVLGFIPEPEAGSTFVDHGAGIIRLWEPDATPQRIEVLQARDIPVWISTGEPGPAGRPCGDFIPETLSTLRDAGAGGFLVNDPLAARAALEKRIV